MPFRLDPKTVRFVLLLFLINKILVMLPAIWATKHLLPGYGWAGYAKYVIFDNFYKWDSGWYGIIAENGYDPKSSAFFPLYPILIFLVKSLLEITPKTAGILIANAAFPVMLYVSYRLLRLDYGEKDTRKIMWLPALYPTSYYFSAAYTESLFLLFLTLTLYFIRKETWAGAGVSGFFASVTRNTGVFLTVPYVLESFKIRSWGEIVPFLRQGVDRKGSGGSKPGIRSPLFWAFAIPLPFFLYMAYLHFKFGDPFAFSHAQTQFGRGFLNPAATLYKGYPMLIHYLTSKPFDWYWIYFFVEFFTVTLVLLVLAATVRKLRISYWIIILYSFLIPLSAPAHDAVIDYFVSFSRYSLAIFPLYPGIYELVKRSPPLYFLTVLAFAVLLVTLVYNWSLDRWVA